MKSAKNKTNDKAQRHKTVPHRAEQLSSDVFYGMSFGRITDYTVISRNPDGSPLSLFINDEWYLPAFAFNNSDNAYFNFLPFYKPHTHEVENVKTCKKLFIIKMFSVNIKTGKPLRVGSMQALQHLSLNMITHCYTHDIKIEDLFGSLEKFQIFHSETQSKHDRSLVALVRTLNTLSSTERGFSMDGGIFPYIQKKSKDSRKESQQFPVIPSRILLFKYHQYQSYMTDFLDNQSGIIDLLDIAGTNPLYGKSANNHHSPNGRGKDATPEQLRNHKKSPVLFLDAIKAHNLHDLCKKYKWKSISNIMGFVSLSAHCAKNLIHLFTLMRDHEVKSLSLDCLSPVKGWNNDALYIAGITTKLYSSAEPKQWITTDAILRPVEVLTRINEILAPYADNPEGYLLLSTALHPAASSKLKKDGLIKKASLESRLEHILITEQDLNELESIEPLRDWRNDRRYKIGAPWKISSHQFRRTMAVFCAQTGLITLPSLKRLLGHITKVMSLYYMKGCSAQNYYFNLINPELSNELQKAKTEADGALFIRDVIHSTEQLFGAKGSEIMKKREKSVWILQAVKDTLKAVSKGLMAYTPTPLGGCASLQKCDKRAHGNFFTCSGCLHFVGKKSSMDDTMAIMEFDLNELDPESVEYRIEKQNLDDFRKMCNSIICKAS